MKDLPNLATHDECCGCSACAQACTLQCIKMKPDADGFLYPEVDMNRCVNCHRCEHACYILNQAKECTPKDAYAFHTEDAEVRQHSSSGGAFTALARNILDKQGVVFAARFDSEYRVVIDYVESHEGLTSFRGSKYVQASMMDSYAKTKSYLDSGREVLFCGTSCQIAGLRSFLKKDYPNLISIDVICHGVPSPAVWKNYLFIVKRLETEDIKNIEFRNKENGWRDFHLTIYSKTDKLFQSTHHREDAYMKAFLYNLSLRPSCSLCKAKCGKSNSDITIADFWGIEKIGIQEDNKGTSLVLINTDKGSELIHQIPGWKTKVDWKEAIKYNPSWHSSYKLHNNRTFFFRYYTLFDKHFPEFVDYCIKQEHIAKSVIRKLKFIRFMKNHLKIKFHDNCYYHLLSITG